MRIILSDRVQALRGSLGRGFGYFIVKRGNAFYSQRSRHLAFVPPNGHWRFIVACAELAKNGLHIADIQVTDKEIVTAISEAGRFCHAYKRNRVFNAKQVLELKSRLGL